MSTYTCAVIPIAPHLEAYGLVMMLDASARDEAIEKAKAAYHYHAMECEVEIDCVDGNQHSAMLEKHKSGMRPEQEHREYEWPSEDLPDGITHIYGTA